MKIFILGPCRKIDRSTGDLHAPFADGSRSGKFLRSIVSSRAKSMRCTVVFDNIIDDSVVDAKGCEYLPSPKTLSLFLGNHVIWTEADVVVALGGDVQRAFAMYFAGTSSQRCAFELHCLPHPSYIMRRPVGERERFKSYLLEILNR